MMRSESPVSSSVREYVLTSDFGDDARWLGLIERLDEPERIAVQMRFLQRRSLAEIAEELQISPAEAARRLLRALRQLRQARND
jgi:RNA polymerase sigma factor (sigma-70 family)